MSRRATAQIDGAPKERPILMSAPMVLATLALRKTVTRRVITRDNSTVDGSKASEEFWGQLDFSRAFVDNSYAADGWSYLHVPSTAPRWAGAVHRVRSRIEPKNHLWVRETWRTGAALDKLNTRQIDESAREAGYPRGWGPVQYEADGVRVGWDMIGDFGGEPGRIRQSIYMPRWASRIARPVISVRPERVQEITDVEVLREGIARLSKDGGRTWKFGLPDRDGLPGTDDVGMPWSEWSTDACGVFAWLWDKINSKRGYGWEKNNWVWRIEYSEKQVVST